MRHRLGFLVGMAGLAAALAIPIARSQTAADIASDPFMKFNDPKDYPDRERFDTVYGQVRYTYHVSGKRSNKDSSLQVDMTLQATLRRDKNAITDTYTIDGKTVLSRNEFDKNNKPCQHVTTTNFSHTQSTHDQGPAGQMFASKKLGLSRVMIAPLLAMGVGGVDWTTSGSGCNAKGNGKGFEALAPSAGNQSTPIDSDKEMPVFVDQLMNANIRIPYSHGGNTGFSQAAAKAEAAGRSPLGILTMPTSGLIEGAWNGSAMHGSLSVAMLGGDTLPVRQARIKDGQDVLPEAAGENDVDPGSQAFPGNLMVVWSLSNKPPEDLELVLEADDYDHWIPSAGKDEKTPGNTIAVKATLQTKQSKKAPDFTLAEKYTFDLADVSHEPGICINYPPKASATGDADMQFDPTANPEATVSGDEHQTAERKTDSPVAAVNVTAYDWGAYATLKVKCVTSDGQTITGTLKAQPGKQYMLLPKRKDGNHIADAWLKTEGLGSDATDADDKNKQDGDDHKGDGYTLYEEYRGVYAKGGHVCLDPVKKNLVVQNLMGDTAGDGLGLFSSASHMNVVVMQDKELDDSRIVNTNHANGDLHKGDQHGVILKAKAGAGDDKGQGETTGAAEPEDFKGTMHPKDCTEVDVYVDTITSGTTAAGKTAGIDANTTKTIIGRSIRDTIAHELGHACGLVHHGTKTVDPLVREITTTTQGYEAYDEKGNKLVPTADHPIEITGTVGVPGDASSGDIHCIMCYNNDCLWLMLSGDAAHATRYYKVPAVDSNAATEFCTSPAGTGINSKDNKPISYFGDATNIDKDGCMAMFDVKDY